MRRPRHTLARFEEHSLALFAALVMGSAGAAAQARDPSLPSSETAIHAQATALTGKPVLHVVQRSASAEQAFRRADSNGDGQLSRDEAQRLPAVLERFDAIDANGDRLLSPDEFHRGVVD